MGDDVPVPGWWTYPRQCENGHPWAPGRVIVRWRRCFCVGEEPGTGHTIVTCGAEGCGWSWYWPSHDACEGKELSRVSRAARPSARRGSPPGSATKLPCRARTWLRRPVTTVTTCGPWPKLRIRASSSALSSDCSVALADSLLGGAERVEGLSVAATSRDAKELVDEFDGEAP